MTLIELCRDYSADDRCRELLARLRWPDGVRCPRCQSTSVTRQATRPVYECQACAPRYQFSVTAGTIFHDSHLPLLTWFTAVYLLCESKKGMSALQVQRMLGISYQTAWYLCHRIRRAMQAFRVNRRKATDRFEDQLRRMVNTDPNQQSSKSAPTQTYLRLSDFCLPMTRLLRGRAHNP